MNKLGLPNYVRISIKELKLKGNLLGASTVNVSKLTDKEFKAKLRISNSLYSDWRRLFYLEEGSNFSDYSDDI